MIGKTAAEEVSTATTSLPIEDKDVGTAETEDDLSEAAAGAAVVTDEASPALLLKKSGSPIPGARSIARRSEQVIAICKMALIGLAQEASERVAFRAEA